MTKTMLGALATALLFTCATDAAAAGLNSPEAVRYDPELDIIDLAD